MPGTVLTCAHVLIDGFEFSSDLTNFEVNFGAETQDFTTFGGGTRIFKGGLKTATISASGYLNLGSSQNDPVLFNFNNSTTPALVYVNGIPVTTSTAEAGYALLGTQTKFNIGTQVGNMMPLAIDMAAAGPIVRAFTLENSLTSVWSTTVNTGVSYLYPTAATSEGLIAGWHVTAISPLNGLGVSGIVQAASSSGFGTATTVVSFSALTSKDAVVSSQVPASGLSTDQPWFRSRVTVATGTSTGASANGIVWFGIQDRY